MTDDSMRKKIKIKSKIRVKPKLNIKARELSDEEKFERQADELRKKVAERDPDLKTQTRLKPTAAQLKRWKNAQGQ